MQHRIAALVLLAVFAGGRLARGDDGPSPADATVAAIEAELKLARRPLPPAEIRAVHERIADLVARFRVGHPDDPRVPRFLNERWQSLDQIDRRREADAEIAAILAAPSNPQLRREALYSRLMLLYSGPTTRPPRLAEVEEFARQAPGDNRVAGFFTEVLHRSDLLVPSRVGLPLTLAVGGVMILIAGCAWSRWRPRPDRPARGRRLRTIAVRLAWGVPLLIVVLLVACRLIAGDRAGEVLHETLGRVQAAGDAFGRSRPGVILQRFAQQTPWQARQLTQWPRTWVALGVAGLVGLVAAKGVARRRSPDSQPDRWANARVWCAGFVATMSAAAALDAGWAVRENRELRARIGRDYPDSHWGRIVLGEQRQRDRIGEPFELAFTDAITGRPVSLRDYRGKVVVVDFWATWCGPCVGEIPELLRLYAEYHDQGVEFVGVSHDWPEADGGLKALRDFVAEHQIPWPQYYDPRDLERMTAGPAVGDFSESWGINGIPTVFVIDRAGNLASTRARGQLDTWIPRLLKLPQP